VLCRYLGVFRGRVVGGALGDAGVAASSGAAGVGVGADGVTVEFTSGERIGSA
jgi:hypothetical protein